MTEAQPTLFDYAAAQAAREAAIDQVEAGTSVLWMDTAIAAIGACAETMPLFTTDDVWLLMGVQTRAQAPDGRAMGAAMRKAQLAGMVEPTSQFRNSVQVSCHSRPKRLWRAAHSEVTA